jgi:hypothetical protein
LRRTCFRNQHLFPNLTVTRCGGESIRSEAYESFSLPFETVGLEVVVLFGGYVLAAVYGI